MNNEDLKETLKQAQREKDSEDRGGIIIIEIIIQTLAVGYGAFAYFSFDWGIIVSLLISVISCLIYSVMILGMLQINKLTKFLSISILSGFWSFLAFWTTLNVGFVVGTFVISLIANYYFSDSIK